MKAKILIAACAGILLSACGNNEIAEMKRVISARLVDPDSAKFGAIAFWPSGTKACVEYNAKNRMGGYSGQDIALLEMKDGKWEVDRMEVSPSSCSNNGKYLAGPN
jgi:hypothetical protein